MTSPKNKAHLLTAKELERQGIISAEWLKRMVRSGVIAKSRGRYNPDDVCWAIWNTQEQLAFYKSRRDRVLLELKELNALIDRLNRLLV